MSATTITTPSRPLFDEARLAVAGFLARYSEPTRRSYTSDLRQFFVWCDAMGLGVFEAKRPHLELWARSMEERGLARARSVGVCPPWPASTGSPASTG